MAKSKGRRVYSPEFKLRVVERMRAGETVGALAAEFGVRRKFFYAWKKAVEQGLGFPGVGHPLKPAVREGRTPEGAERIKELEALAGRLTLENRFFAGALQSIAELRQARGASSSVASSRKSKR